MLKSAKFDLGDMVTVECHARGDEQRRRGGLRCEVFSVVFYGISFMMRENDAEEGNLWWGGAFG